MQTIRDTLDGAFKITLADGETTPVVEDQVLQYIQAFVRQRNKKREDIKSLVLQLSKYRDLDPGMSMTFTTDRNGELVTLVLVTSSMRRRYQMYGTVVSMDATYCKNKNSIPLFLITTRSNNNVLGLVGLFLTATETAESLTRGLLAFKHAVGGWSPRT